MDFVLLIFWILIYLYQLIKHNSYTIMKVPLIIILTKLSFQTVTFSAYYRGITLLGYALIFYVVLLSIIELKNSRIIKDRLFTIIIFFVIFILLSTMLNSSDPWLSFKRSLSIVTSLILFIALYYKHITKQHYLTGLKSMIYYMVFFAINFIFLSALSIGPSLNEFTYMSGYAANFLRTGTFGFFELHGVLIISSIILVYKKILKGNLQKTVVYISFVAILIMTFFTYKRTFLAIILTGILLYYLLFIITNKNIIRNIFISLFSLIVFYTATSSFISDFMNERSIANEQFAESGRIMEFILYPQAVLEQDYPALFLLIGSETFVSTGEYKILNEELPSDNGRFLHNDFAHLLYGTGFIGLITYIYIIVFLLKKSYSYAKANNLEIKLYGTGAFILVSVIIISGLGDGILSFQNRIVPFFGIGLLLGTAKTQIN